MGDKAFVLDASALLALLLAERGAEAIEERLADACVSAVNLSEVVAKLADRGVPPRVIVDVVMELDLDVRDFDLAQATRAGLLRPDTRDLGLSLGDRACLSLAASMGAVAITTDHAWTVRDLGIPIELIR